MTCLSGSQTLKGGLESKKKKLPKNVAASIAWAIKKKNLLLTDTNIAVHLPSQCHPVLVSPQFLLRVRYQTYCGPGVYNGVVVAVAPLFVKQGVPSQIGRLDGFLQ